MPGEITICYELLGPMNRTLAGAVRQQVSGELNLILEDVEIITFTNNTAYNLSWTQNNTMDIVDDYFAMAEVSLKFC